MSFFVDVGSFEPVLLPCAEPWWPEMEILLSTLKAQTKIKGTYLGILLLEYQFNIELGRSNKSLDSEKSP